MDDNSKKVVDIFIARAKNGDIEKERRLDKLKKCVFILFLMSLVFLGFYTYETEITKPSLNAEYPVSKLLPDGTVEVLINQHASGHYIFIGEINGKEVKFLLDTGATTIAVPVGLANYLKLPFGESFYSSTANGNSLSYASKAKNVKVGEISLSNVDAAVPTGMKGDEILLGMSFLKDLKLIQEDRKLYLVKSN